MRGYAKKHIIYRHINNISLNGKEYVLDDNNETMRFSSPDDAIKFLHKNGIAENVNDKNDLFDNYGFGIELEEKEN